MNELLAQAQPIIDKYGIVGYISIGGLLLIQLAVFVAIYLLIGTLFDLMLKRDMTKIKKWWKIVGKILLSGIGLMVISIIITVIKGIFA